jgi:hypothetical protein
MITLELDETEAEILLMLIKGTSIVPAERRHLTPIEMQLENYVGLSEGEET